MIRCNALTLLGDFLFLVACLRWTPDATFEFVDCTEQGPLSIEQCTRVKALRPDAERVRSHRSRQRNVATFATGGRINLLQSESLMHGHLETLEAVESGFLSTDEAALRLGTSVDEVRSSLRVLSLSRDIAQRELTKARRTQLRRLAVAGMVAVVSGLVWFSAPALAQVACAQTLPSPLKTFCPEAPALASDVNANFQGVVNMLTNKTGPLSAPNAITTSALTVTAGVLDFGSRTGPLINLYGTDYGLGIQNATAWSRTGANFAWFKNGTFSQNTFDPGTGGTTQMTLDTNGNLAVRGQLAGATLRQTDCQWGPSGPSTISDNQMHSMFCPAGRYMAGFRCFAQTYLDGDCAAYCCLP